MSNRAINAVLDFSQTKGDDRVLMFVIADGISKDTGAYPARISTLMRQCNRSESTVHRHVNRCIRSGELIVLDGLQSANTFYIPILPGEAGFAPESCEGGAHSCNGYHTPLSIDRESISAGAIKAARSQRKSQRRGAKSDTLPAKVPAGVPDVTPPPVSSDTPPCQEWHPPVPEAAPNTHINTLSITPSNYQGASTKTQNVLTKPAERHELWDTVRRELGRHMTAARLRHFDGSHLYALDGDGGDGEAYALYVPSANAARQAAMYDGVIARAIRITTGRAASVAVLTGEAVCGV